MLRAIDDVDGQGIYIRKLCDALFESDPRNEYVAFYSRRRAGGTIRDRPNVREVVVPGTGKLLWDQVLVPLAARRESLDVLFHHKFSIPLAPPCPTVVQQRGTEYWSHPEFYVGWSGRLDRLYNRLMIPLYCRRAVRVLTNSDTLGDELVRYVGRSALQAAHGVRRGRRELPADHRSGRAGRGPGALPASGRAVPVDGGQGPPDPGAGLREDAHAAQERRGGTARRTAACGGTPPPGARRRRRSSSSASASRSA